MDDIIVAWAGFVEPLVFKRTEDGQLRGYCMRFYRLPPRRRVVPNVPWRTSSIARVIV
jgi:hypothetical protein